MAHHCLKCLLEILALARELQGEAGLCKQFPGTEPCPARPDIPGGGAGAGVEEENPGSKGDRSWTPRMCTFAIRVDNLVLNNKERNDAVLDNLTFIWQKWKLTPS